MAKRGRPPKFTEPDKIKLAEEFEEYINKTELPIIAEFAASKGLWKSYLHDNQEFANLIKRCTTKKESALERGTLKGELNPAMAIFSLKQMGIGWKDRAEKIIFVDPKTLSEAELKKLMDDGS